MTHDSFTPTGYSGIEKDADLVVYLLDWLESKRDPGEHIWRGERHMRTLQYTSHVVEALCRLGLRGMTEYLLTPAAEWLTELPLDPSLPPEEGQALRLFPSRFKTLALLGRLDAWWSDYGELTRLMDRASGWISNAPLDLSPALTTMIWMDTLLTVPTERIEPVLRLRQKEALQAIAGAFGLWIDKAAAGPLPDGLGYRANEIANSGDASYALDLLLRCGQLQPASPRAATARQALTQAIQHRRLGDMRRTDLLYAGLHLRTHFPDDPAIHTVVEGFIEDVRERYLDHDAQREAVPFHALVLRLLTAHHGPPLAEAVLHKLWQTNREQAQAQAQAARVALETEFAELVRQSIRINLGTPQRLTGTRARGEVYRVRFGLTTEATDERGAPLSAPSNTLRLIIKKGPVEILARAMERYRALPEPLQRLFARHTTMTPGYLMMQDLADMQPLSEALTACDRQLPRDRQLHAAQLARSVADLLARLHRYEKQTGVIHQYHFNLTYLAPMAHSLNRLCQPNAFPELKQWLEGPLTANGWTFKRPDWYFKQLSKAEPRLRPPTLGYIHGDCHSRNIMLAQDFGRALFVDIDTLAATEDYILDYGLLIEDLAVYQSLPYDEEAGRISWDAIETRRPDTQDTTLENWIEYPAFPQRSEATRAFQRELLQRLQTYAESIDDPHWKKRLWLAIARGLLMLASRQLTSQTVEARRRPNQQKLVNDLKLVQVSYAEALRLLYELQEHLERKEVEPLPELPFPGEHRAPRLAAPSSGQEIAALRDALAQELGEAAVRRSDPETPYFIDYATRSGQQTFLRIHARSSAPMLLLPFPASQLYDPKHLLQAADGDWPARLALSAPLSDLMALVRQAFQLAIASGINPGSPRHA